MDTSSPSLFCFIFFKMGCEDESVLKSTGWSCKGLRFNSKHHVVAYSSCTLGPGIQCLFLWAPGVHMVQMHADETLNFFFQNLKVTNKDWGTSSVVKHPSRILKALGFIPSTIEQIKWLTWWAAQGKVWKTFAAFLGWKWLLFSLSR